MGKLNRSDDTTNKGPGYLTINQGDFRGQQNVVGDSLLQLGGRGEVSQGATVNDPLNAPFVLYVNPYTGKDDIVFGSYATSNADVYKRIESQRLVCGYTEAAPFKSLNRAVVEAGIITSKNYFNEAATIPFERVCIVLAPGTYDLNCGGGAAPGDVNTYDESTDTVDDAFLVRFNPQTVGGIILPRGCSVVSLDLRKTILRPGTGTVPATADEAADYSNRRCMLRVTGEGYYYGMTFMDEASKTSSHHLMSVFEFASESQLNDFYTKITNAFTSLGNSNMDTATARATEWQITGPQPAVGSLTAATDTTKSASPYIYNCSIRSDYGLCGIFADGSKPAGFRSMVVAQFTGVSLQNDYTSWEQYSGGSWGAVSNFTAYKNADPDDIRMKAGRRSFHVRAINRAVLQQVSVFAIGQGVHHWTESAGELTITNSNSNFGGCASLSTGYSAEAPPQDTGYAATHQRVPTDLSEKSGNIRQIFIGTVDASAGNTDTTIQLTADVAGLGDYTLEPGSYVWIESPTTADYRAQLGTQTGTDTIVVTSAVQTDSADGNASPGDPIGTTGTNYPDIANRRVYIRRLVDTRSQDERRYALLFDPLATARLPQRDYILRTDGDGVGNASTIDVAVLRAGPTTLNDTTTAKVQVELKQINPNQAFRANSVYRPGDSVVANNKHYICNKQFVSGGSLSAGDLTDYFAENYVHMQDGSQGTGYMPEDYFKNVQPVLIFDNDSDEAEDSTTLGWVFDQSAGSNVWTGGGAKNAKVQAQFRTATDYRGLERYLTSKSETIAAPRPAASRDQALGSNKTDQEFRRPSIIRMYGHAFEWAGFGNYTKGLPQYQGGMLASNKFTYYGTSELGGRVYFTGFNEEGFSVSPRGVEDIQTGEVLSAEQINAPDIELDIPTNFDNITINDTLTAAQIDVTNLNINGVVNGLQEATTEKKGIIRKAKTSEAATGTDDDSAVTPLGLAGALTAATGSIASVPTGVIQWFCGAEASKPTGWLVCNGDTVPNGSGTIQGVEADFSDLYALLGSTYGSAGQLPDLQGTFVRGWTSKDTGSYNETPGANYNPDPSRDRGSHQQQATIDHSHDYTETNHSHEVQNQLQGSGGGYGSGGSTNTIPQKQTNGAQTDIVVNGIHTSTSSSLNPGSIDMDKVDANETRPTNIALLPIIKI